MRLSLLTLVTTLAVGASAVPAAAAPSYPWCARYSSSGGECSFATFEQCMANVSGIGGFCQANPGFNPGSSPAYAYSPRQRHHAQ